MKEPRWPAITPEDVCLLQLHDCVEQLKLAQSEPIRLVQAAKSMHLALQAALTFALAGSAGVGAYPDSLRTKWLEFLESNREAVSTVELSRRIMDLKSMLDRLEKPRAVEWLNEPIGLTSEDRQNLEKLVFVRDQFEHPKPGVHAFEPAWVRPVFASAARLTLELIHAVHHRFEPQQLTAADRSVTQIIEATSNQ